MELFGIFLHLLLLIQFSESGQKIAKTFSLQEFGFKCDDGFVTPKVHQVFLFNGNNNPFTRFDICPNEKTKVIFNQQIVYQQPPQRQLQGTLLNVLGMNFNDNS